VLPWALDQPAAALGRARCLAVVRRRIQTIPEPGDLFGVPDTVPFGWAAWGKAGRIVALTLYALAAPGAGRSSRPHPGAAGAEGGGDAHLGSTAASASGVVGGAPLGPAGAEWPGCRVAMGSRSGRTIAAAMVLARLLVFLFRGIARFKQTA